jgi:hypothetical protein
MGRKAVNYDFESCRCLGINGRSEWIPEGRWLVSDLGNVVVLINEKRIELQRAAFHELKTANKAIKTKF